MILQSKHYFTSSVSTNIIICFPEVDKDLFHWKCLIYCCSGLLEIPWYFLVIACAYASFYCCSFITLDEFYRTYPTVESIFLICMRFKFLWKTKRAEPPQDIRLRGRHGSSLSLCPFFSPTSIFPNYVDLPVLLSFAMSPLDFLCESRTIKKETHKFGIS